MDVSERATVAAESARAGGAVALEQFRTVLDVEVKDGKTDVVTRADRLAQGAVVDRIRESFPDATIVGEEEEEGTASSVPDDGTAWVVDPIDGTNNFVRGNRRWATSVARLVDGRPVAAANLLPAMGDAYVATPDGVRVNGAAASVSDRTDPERFVVVPTVWWGFDRRDEYAAATRAIVQRFADLRRIGCAQAALSMLAAGRLDGVITNIQVSPWDSIAGAAMVEWAGGTVTGIEGEEWRYDSRGLVASNGGAHDAVLAAAQEIEAAADG
ncbi:inositol monophosphatase [Halobacteriales archaeon QH_2_65_14]|nr:MAG: inositol monophosphatase [Halobacteriales archaeon QH_2_65_14]